MENEIMKSEAHPGIILNQKLLERGISQREIASILGIAHSHLNDILNGKKNINASIAMSLEAINLETAFYWMKLQVLYQIDQLRQNHALMQKTGSLKEWNSYMDLIPVKFFKSQGLLGEDIAKNIETVNRLYGVTDYKSLQKRVSDFRPSRYRKSSALPEELHNVLGWEVLAAAKAKEIKVKEIFDPAKKENLITELNAVFYKNKNTLEDTTKVLSKYGIKFSTLDRPSQTPVDGKTFKVDGIPAICLTLKYKRLDNFAYTVMHELGHVFLHLTESKKYANGFYSEDKSIDHVKEETEADQFASTNLIPQSEWERFYYAHDFSDNTILSVSKKLGVHPAIIRGRVCYYHNEYYLKRTKINALNTRT